MADIDSAPDMLPIVEAFLCIYSIASFIANFEYVSKIFGSAPYNINQRINLESLD